MIRILQWLVAIIFLVTVALMCSGCTIVLSDNGGGYRHYNGYPPPMMVAGMRAGYRGGARMGHYGAGCIGGSGHRYRGGPPMMGSYGYRGGYRGPVAGAYLPAGYGWSRWSLPR